MGHVHGEKIMLREYMIEDLPSARAWVNDEQVTGMLSHRFLPPQTYDMTEEYYRAVISGSAAGYHFVIADKQSGDYIGQVDLFNLQQIDRTVDMGIVIGNPRDFGKGYGSEAVSLVLRFAFQDANLRRVCLTVDADNPRAIRVYEKNGFVREGVLRKHNFVRGAYRDIVQMGILREEWRDLQQ